MNKQLTPLEKMEQFLRVEKHYRNEQIRITGSVGVGFACLKRIYYKLIIDKFDPHNATSLRISFTISYLRKDRNRTAEVVDLDKYGLSYLTITDYLDRYIKSNEIARKYHKRLYQAIITKLYLNVYYHIYEIDHFIFD